MGDPETSPSGYNQGDFQYQATENQGTGDRPVRKPIRGAYLASGNYVKGAEYGSVAGKIAAQVDAFLGKGISCHLIPIKDPQTRWETIINWAPFLPTIEGWEPSLISPDFHFIYIRKPIFSRKFILFLREVRLRNPSIKIILEIPTFPYDREMHGIIGGVSRIKDRHYRRQLCKYVDRIADLSQHEKIFGVPTLAIINGVNLAAISPRHPSLLPGEMHILSASGMCEWHGLDRAISGLAKYKADNAQAKRIVLHFAGKGPELKRLQSMAIEANLIDDVVFHGELNQDELSDLYNKCTFAIESLGCHRKDLQVSSSIKSREYLAKGIPFVYSTPIDVIPEAFGYCLKAPEDESPLDFKRISAFHDYLYEIEDEADIITHIRNYAKDTVSIDEAMKAVISYIQEDESVSG